MRGIIYTTSRKELKKLNLRQATVRDKKTAYYYALRMCRYWIDNRQTELERLLERQRERCEGHAKKRVSIQSPPWTRKLVLAKANQLQLGTVLGARQLNGRFRGKSY